MKTVQPNSFSKTPVAIRVNLLQFGPSVPSFVFAVLSGYCYVSLNFVARDPFLETPDNFPGPKTILGEQYSPKAIQFLLILKAKF